MKSFTIVPTAGKHLLQQTPVSVCPSLSICCLVSLALQALLIASACLKCWNKCTEKSLELSLSSCETHASIDFNGKRS